MTTADVTGATTTRRSLVGRLAAVQVGLTLAALAAVLALAFGTVDALLARDLDQTLGSLADAVGATINRAPEDDEDPDQWISEELGEQAVPGTRFEVRDPGGKSIAAVGAGPPLLASGPDGCHDEASDWRACVKTVGAHRIVVGRSRAAAAHTRNLIYLGLGAAALIVAIAAVTLSRRVARQALAPLSLITGRIAEIAPGSGARVGSPAGLRELDALSARFDELLTRVDDALARERRFAAEASHELRTPLTVLRAEIESLARDAGDRKGSAGRALTSVDDLCRIVESLLVLARAEAPFDRPSLPLVNLADLVRERAAALGRAPQHAGRVFDVNAPDEVLLHGDERLLGHAVTNLLDNAAKYSPPDRPVEVALAVSGPSGDASAAVTVRDGGPGVPRAQTDRIFEPFLRGADARAGVAGHGLGLPLARAVARAHGGDVTLAESTPGGSCFCLRLPIDAGGA